MESARLDRQRATSSTLIKTNNTEKERNKNINQRYHNKCGKILGVHVISV